MKRVLVTGASGLLGIYLCKLLTKEYSVYGTYHKHPLHLENVRMLEMDVTNHSQCSKVFSRVKPHAVFHTAALTLVDFCEDNAGIAEKINVQATANIARACNKFDSSLIFPSTSYVFDGEKGMYSETDKTNPINVYARTKLDAENVIKQETSDYVIARTVVLYGWNLQNRLNFVTWVLSRLEEGETVNAFNNMYDSPTHAGNLSEALLALYKKGCSGLYNATGSERISRYDFALNIAKVFSHDETIVRSVPASFVKQKALRPVDSSCSVSKIEMDSGVKMLNTVKGLERMRSEK